VAQQVIRHTRADGQIEAGGLAREMGTMTADAARTAEGTPQHQADEGGGHADEDDNHGGHCRGLSISHKHTM